MLLYDFIEYWASSRLLVSGQNPYSPTQLLALQKSVGWSDTIPLIMWNPPWTLTLLVPFGYLDFITARLLWIVLLAVSALFSSRHLWQLYGGNPSRYRLGWIMTLTFAPTIGSFFLQQINLLTVVGIVGFLHFVARDKHWQAGLSLVLVTVKPHLYFLFWLLLFFWIVERRAWRLITGFLVGMICASALPLALDHRIFSEFLQLYLTAPPPNPFDWETATLARASRRFIDEEQIWLQYIPAIVGIVWACGYWIKRRAAWDWTKNLPLILVVSVMTNLFAWSHDQVVILPALIQGAAWCAGTRDRRNARLTLAAYVAIELVIFAVKIFTAYDFWYFWLASVWTILYWFVRKTMLADKQIDSPSAYPLPG